MFVFIKLSVLLLLMLVEGGHVDEEFDVVDEVGDVGDDNEEFEEAVDDACMLRGPPLTPGLFNKTPTTSPPPPPLPVPFNGRGIVSFRLDLVFD